MYKIIFFCYNEKKIIAVFDTEGRTHGKSKSGWLGGYCFRCGNDECGEDWRLEDLYCFRYRAYQAK